MGYTKKNWQDGDIIEANALNNIESGIEELGSKTENMISDPKGITIPSGKHFYTGEVGSEVWSGFHSKRNLGGVQYEARYGVGLYGGGHAQMGLHDVTDGDVMLNRLLLNKTDLYTYAPTNIGTFNNRFGTLYTTEAPNVSSDKSLKENISYIKSSSDAEVLSSEAISTDEMYSFVKDELKLANYNYIENSDKTLGFIAQDYVDTKVGKEFIREDGNGLLSYDTGAYTNVLAGALQKALEKIESLEARIVELESK